MMKILIIDDEKAIRETLQLFLQEKGHEVVCSADGEGGLTTVRTEQPDIVILDVRLPGVNGLDVLRKIKEMEESVSVIMMTGYHDMETTIQAMKIGAYEYIHKPIDIEELEVIIAKVINNRLLNSRLEDLIMEISEEYKVNNIVGKTKVMQEIFKIIGLVSESRATVLIQGETGTGKELIAKAVHYNSANRKEPFVAVNCSALVETLLESELFGHEKGAFTGATSAKKGKIELARNGTIFLDEVGEVSPGFQVKLLRFLQEKEFERVGGEQLLRSNARIIAATNKDLSRLVAEKKFREDLYFRLKVVEIYVPPLRERKADIPFLVEHLLHKINRELHKKVTKIPKEVMKGFMNYHWPGNVRELENLLTRALVLSKGDILLPEYLSDLFMKGDSDTREPATVKPLEEIKKQQVLHALERAHWDKGKTCDLLKISRPTLRKIIKKYDLHP
ncbi:MAG: sigma-54-dependent Fis family transcriptional regulator [Deltaproteobacteria bacterium]|nr:sigma-54-dependent Fis family transcriptional regulator [Deltaproteobacteria bacterium]